MFRSFRGRLTATYLLLIVIVLTLTGFIVSYEMKNFVMDSFRTKLVNEARLGAELASSIPADQEADDYLQKVAIAVAKNTGTRVTIVDTNGQVRADSEYTPESITSHYHRPEIFQALQNRTGSDIRLSDTAGIPFLYTAVSFSHADVSGAIRLAEPLQHIDDLFTKLLYLFLAAIAITGLIAFLISFLLARYFSEPVQEVTRAVSDMAQGNLKRQVTTIYHDELGVLATAVNQMAQNLDQSMSGLAEVNNRLATLLANTINGILMVDKDGRVAYANPVAIGLVGTDTNYEGRNYVEFISTYQLIESVDKVKTHLEPVRQEIKLFNRGDKTIETNIVPITEAGDTNLYGILIVLNDISAIKRLEQVRKDFVANVSHELKTPVATISGFAETLLAENPDNHENVREFSQIIYNEAQRLTEIISQLLELSRLEADPNSDIQVIDIGQVINKAVKAVKHKFVREQLNINIIMPPDTVWVEADLDSIDQVMENLIDNAVKYTFAENKLVTVVVEQFADHVQVVVEDKGDGIPGQDIPRIFERFYRVDKARCRRSGGSGLGLAIVKHLVENMGGKVWAESVLGQGSRFYFTVPRATR
jgi:two-component system phosphate regulon sensor histidine kinase PhoR